MRQIDGGPSVEEQRRRSEMTLLGRVEEWRHAFVIESVDLGPTI